MDWASVNIYHDLQEILNDISKMPLRGRKNQEQ